MVLDPLAEVGVGMLVTVLVRRGQFVVDFQGHGEGGQGQQRADQRKRNHRPERPTNGSRCQYATHRWRLVTKTLSPVNLVVFRASFASQGKLPRVTICLGTDHAD